MTHFHGFQKIITLITDGRNPCILQCADQITGFGADGTHKNDYILIGNRLYFPGFIAYSQPSGEHILYAVGNVHTFQFYALYILHLIGL